MGTVPIFNRTRIFGSGSILLRIQSGFSSVWGFIHLGFGLIAVSVGQSAASIRC